MGEQSHSWLAPFQKNGHSTASPSSPMPWKKRVVRTPIFSTTVASRVSICGAAGYLIVSTHFACPVHGLMSSHQDVCGEQGRLGKGWQGAWRVFQGHSTSDKRGRSQSPDYA